MHHRPESSLDFTVREIQVLDLLTLGLATKQIAAQLHISEKRVEQLRRSIRRKLHVPTNIQAVEFVRGRHLLRPERENVGIIQEHWEAINTHDRNEFVATLGQECIWESDTMPQMARGLGPARDGIQVYFDAFPDLTMETDYIVCRGDHGTVYWWATGTHKGEFLGIPPSDQRGRVRGCTHVKVSDGKIVYMRDYWDMNSLLEQLGVIRLRRYGQT